LAKDNELLCDSSELHFLLAQNKLIKIFNEGNDKVAVDDDHR